MAKQQKTESFFREYVLPLALLLLAVLFFYWGLLSDKIIFISDFLTYQFPEKDILRQCFIEGMFPFINPYILCGAPLLENIDAGAMNLLNVIFIICPGVSGINLFIVIHYFLSAITMFFLLKKAFGFNSALCALGGLSYSICGYLWSMAGYGFYRSSFIIPIFFLAYFSMIENKGSNKLVKIWFVIAIVSLTLLFYCGNFLDAYFTVIFSFLLLLFYANNRRNEHIRFSYRSFIYLISMAIIAFLLASPQLLPTILAALQSYRAEGINLIEAQQWSFPPVRTIEFVLPFIFGLPGGGGTCYGAIYKPEETFSQTGLSPWASSVFIGIPLILGLIIFFRRGGWKESFLLSAFILSFILALGKFTPGYGIFYHILPGFKMFRHPEKFMLWVSFWGIISGVSGLNLVFDRKGKLLTLFKITTGVFFISFLLLAAFLTVFFVLEPENYVRFFQNMGSHWNGGRIFLWQITVILLSMAALIAIFASLKTFRDSRSVIWCFACITFLHSFFFQYKFEWIISQKDFSKIHHWDEKLPEFDGRLWRIFSTKKFVYPVDAGIVGNDSFKAESLFQYSKLDCNLPALFKIRTVSGFSPLIDAQYSQFMNFDLNPPEKVLDLLSVKYIGAHSLSDHDVPSGSRIIYRDDESGYVILENTDALPRVKVYSNPIFVNEKEIYKTLFNLKRDFQKTFVIDEKYQSLCENRKSNLRPELEILNDKPGLMEFSIKGPAWLVIRDWNLPGWKCTDADGEVLPIVEADGGLMAVFAEKENSKIEFRYLPPGFKASIFLVLAGLLLIPIIIRKIT